MTGYKKCWDCKNKKQHSQFYKDKSRRDGVAHRCMVCCRSNRKAKSKEYAAYHKAKRRAGSSYESAYGITLQDYELLKEKQKHMCKICHTKAKLYVDHCHETNNIRGLLCQHCNSMLGFAKDSQKILLKGIAYLNKNRS